MDKVESETGRFIMYLLWAARRDFRRDIKKVSTEAELAQLRTKYLGEESVVYQVFKFLGKRDAE
jgi:hypothetical protein